MRSKKGKIDVRGLARFITSIESREPSALSKLADMPLSSSQVIGITGPPGAGKSTLADGVIKYLRKKGKKVAVVAIDPSSPFSGGAVLGDRIRMQSHAGDSGVFIRSVGSRGSHGGLSRAARDIVRVLSAHGFDYVIVETVGVGQTELDIMEIADVTIVVLVPESGDMVQTMKAGLLEIADIFVVNKADRPGAEQMQTWLKGAFDNGTGFDEETIKHHGGVVGGRRSVKGHREIPALLTQANKDIGIFELMNAIGTRLKFVKTDQNTKTRRQNLRRQEFFDMCADEFKLKLERLAKENNALKKIVSLVSNGRLVTYKAQKIVGKLLNLNRTSNKNRLN